MWMLALVMVPAGGMASGSWFTVTEDLSAETLMLPVFLYWFWLQLRGKTVFPKGMAFTNVLIIFALLKGLSLAMPVSAFRLGFTNGLMSESMILWFGIMLIWERRVAA